MAYRTLALIAQWVLTGCTGIVATAGDTDGSGETDRTTTTATSPPTSADASSGSDTTGTPGSSGGSSSDSSGGADESTSTGSQTATNPVRFAFRTQDPTRLLWTEYTDGEATSPIDLLPDAPEGYTLSTTAAFDDGRFLSTCWRVLPGLETTCGIVDVSTDPPSEFRSLIGGDLSEGLLLAPPTWVPATRTLWLRASSVEGVDAGVFASEVVDGSPSATVRVLEPGEADSFSVGPDGLQLGYRRETEDGNTELYVRSTDPKSKDPPTLFSTPAPEGFRNATVRLLPTHDAVIYAVNYPTNLIPNTASLWFVDLSGDTPSAPVRIDGTTTAPNRIDREIIAPDEHAMAFWVGPDDEINGEYVWVDLSSGAPQPPERISDLSDASAAIVRPQWSSDSRWFGYEADHGGAGFRSVYLVDASGSSPGAPIQIGEGISVDDVSAWVFSADAQWLYVTAPFGQPEPRVFRVDISGETPGDPEVIAGPPGWADGEMILSADGMAMLHPAIEDSRSLAWADLSAEVLRPSVLIHGPLARDVDVTFGARFAADASAVAYSERGDDGVSLLRITDLASGDVAVVDDEIDVGSIYPMPAPR